MQVSNLCSTEVVTVEEGDSILEAARRMRQHHVGDVVVLPDDGARKPVGILTDRDITIELVANEMDLGQICVGDVMSYDLVAVDADEEVLTALDIMTEQGIRRVPVVDGDGCLCGVLSIDDVIGTLADAMRQIANLFEIQKGREEFRLAG